MSLSKLTAENQSRMQQLYQRMGQEHLLPLWELLAGLVTPEPQSPARVYKWSFDSMRHYLLEAGGLITAEQAERRVLILENPDMPGSSAIVPSLYAGLQLVLPGEIAPSHRHSQSALRFVLEGEGAFTALNGEKAVMSQFDLVLTPSWQWHDHGNETEQHMIWLDGLDIPAVRSFDAAFAERLDEKAHKETQPPGDTLKRYGKNMRPFSGSAADTRPVHQPLFHYPYQDWMQSLRGVAEGSEIDPHLGHALEFINPATGGSVMPIISAHVRLLPAGFETKTRQSSDGSVATVVSGHGEARIGDKILKIGPRDIFTIPSWKELQLRADSELVLFIYSDKGAQEKLGLYREKCS
ncbi:gentisate 1,2-dioxygenase [Hirschia baltica]|uniref:Gentisate 1,2-dioxygenase n=1 Tax=Hirschia baltica (strain ATCC 49814 / DSM 5838 / IFAM 1418) TaxID=582402 RepID=C6XPQ0_HIRBI|nr:gentisate 1,2-dioxygenase [Hirschia baltica]ACT60315.1 gentisate 1,2-dioxygenase [Hirschia baltica ATCC 49814]